MSNEAQVAKEERLSPEQIYAAEATGKYAKELKLVERISDSLVLFDAEATVGAGAIDSMVGFGKIPGATITFSTKSQNPYGFDNAYREAGEEHAVEFTKNFNRSLVEQVGQNVVPLTNRALARAEGNQVHFDLGALRELLSAHAVADELPNFAQKYSVQHGVQKAVSQVQQTVAGTISQRTQARVQAAQKDRILDAVEKVLEDPAYIQEVVRTDVALARDVQANMQVFAGLTSQVAGGALDIEKLRESDPRVAGIVEKLLEQVKERPVPSPVSEPDAKEAAQDKAPSFVEKVGKAAPSEKGFADRVKEEESAQSQGAARG